MKKLVICTTIFILSTTVVFAMDGRVDAFRNNYANIETKTNDNSYVLSGKDCLKATQSLSSKERVTSSRYGYDEHTLVIRFHDLKTAYHKCVIVQLAIKAPYKTVERVLNESGFRRTQKSLESKVFWIAIKARSSR